MNNQRLNGITPKIMPIREYAREVYEAWDQNGVVEPPKGYDTWMQYWEKFYGNDKRNA